MPISPFLWFDTQAEEAAQLYASIFPNSRFTPGARNADGSVLTVAFELDGQKFVALNGGPAHANFTEAISFVVTCETQEEVDRYWAALTADGGEEGRCGWLKDRFGLSWQIVPRVLPELLTQPDADKAQRVTAAMLEMRKLDIAALEAAAE
ncbi:MAG TPA: VOC family protein [Gaiellaceae bacterium]|nr:VOC family protein [Gaiellaceae bacterium]